MDRPQSGIATVSIEVDRAVARNFWAEAEPFARRILEGEKRCCVCGRQDVPVYLVVEGGKVGRGFYVVGLLGCDEHSGYYARKDYKFVNGVLLYRETSTSKSSTFYSKVGSWFDIPWMEFAKMMSSYTEFSPYSVGEELKSNLSRGMGNLCWKFLEFPKQEFLDWCKKWGIQICPFCKARNKLDFIYCTKCGKKMNE